MNFIRTLSMLSIGLLLSSSVSNSGITADAGEKMEFSDWVQNRAPQIPEQEDLAGEVVPLDLFGVREQLDREMIANTYHHSSTMLYFKRAARWFPIIEPILKEKGLPDDFKYLCIIESGMTQAVSPAGAAGFWQFMKATAPRYGLEVTNEVDERYHVEKSTQAACDYLLEAYDEFDSWALAAASYNMGKGGVRKQLSRQGVDTYWELHLNSETARYVYRLLAVKTIFEEPAKYGFALEEETLYRPYRTRKIRVEESIPDLASFAVEQGSNLKALKVLNPWLRKDELTIEPGESFTIELPA
ncbi:MAG: transglycosylase SLT domain-containing protein [Flavobacteriales bacterium]